jgi:signal transduction histidine kinase
LNDSAIVTENTLHKLQERVKELTALHRTARILQDDERSSREILLEILSLLPAAWQFPGITEARILYGDLELATPGFRTTDWLQTGRFATRNQVEGRIEIVYLEERPPESEGPFLAEERELLDSLAEMLRSYFERKLADGEIHAAYARLEGLVAERTQKLRESHEHLEREVEQHRQARLQIEEYENRLRQLATELTLTDARERRQIAVDLHDHIIQEFAFIKLRIAQFRGDAMFCGFERSLEDIISLLEGAIQHTRKLTFEISAPILYELGLPAALEWLGEQYETRHKLKVKVTVPRKWKPLGEAVRVLLFRCVQELLTNVVKYAGAKTAAIKLSRRDGTVTVEVADDGVGFDVSEVERISQQSGGFGLFSIRERLKYFNGEMFLESAKGKGTIVRLSVGVEN